MEWHQNEIAKVFEILGTTPSGLSHEEAEKRLLQYGPNAVRSEKEKSLVLIFLSQFANLIVYLLIVAAMVSFIFGDRPEAIAILAVILINAIIGFIMEAQAQKSMSALKKLDQVYANVFRDGKAKKISSEKIVPGDVLMVEAGDLIAADARLFQESKLQADESALTGESYPVEKNTAALPGNTSLAERTNMLYKGTAITRGNGKAVVVETGMKTELGQISGLVQSAGKDELPLNVKLKSFSKKLIWLTLAIIIPFALLGLAKDRDLYVMIETAIALAVAAIPEGLPIVATIALARGMLKLAKNKVIVKQLAAVETLGETNVIFTDKTGTITENKLVVNTICVAEHIMEIRMNDASENIDVVQGTSLRGEQENVGRLLEIAVLCNNASFDAQEHALGDPLEVALLKFAAYYRNGHPGKIKRHAPRVAEQPFDSDTKIMGTLHRWNQGYFVAAKGASEELLNYCSHLLVDGNEQPLSETEKNGWLKKTDDLARHGLKVLAFAYRQMKKEQKDFMTDLVFTGLIGFLDPPRQDVPQAIRECKEAGIRVVMVTGDHPATARNISLKIGLASDEKEKVVHGSSIRKLDALSKEEKNELENAVIFSRVTPVQKLELVQLYKQKGEVVAMTGDGVNDAPALKTASIGIAMGIRGTQVSQEAADLVLQDDAFPSIVKAIKQGRIIFNNIRNFIIYLLSCNLSEILVVSVAGFANLALPLQPLQILFLNIVTDVFPALALGMGEGNPSVMRKPPRDSKQPFLIRKNWIAIIIYSLVLTGSVLSVFLFGLFVKGYSDKTCNNIAFLSLAFAQLLHPLNLIPAKEPLLKNDIVRNPHLWGAVILCTAIIMGVYFINYTREMLSFQPLTIEHWLLVITGSVLPLLIIQALKRARLIY